MKKYSFLIFVSLFSSNVFCQDSVTNTSRSSLNQSWKKLIESVDVKYRSIFGFSQTQEEENDFEGKIDYDEAPAGRMLNDLEIGTDLSDKLSASIVGVWSVQPQQEEMSSLEALDPYAKDRKSVV